jgi:hypothetical protein
MKTISSPHYALVVCAAAVMLADCGGSAQLPNPTSQTSLGNASAADRAALPNDASSERIGSDSPSTETLTAKRVTHHCFWNGTATICHFRTTAPGTAVGPYPGTFTAHGSSSEGSGRHGQPLWSFKEAFTITSGSSTVTGTISGSGSGSSPKVYDYKTDNGYSGNAMAHVGARHFHEKLYGM